MDTEQCIDDEIKSIVGDIDMKILKLKCVENLYYTLPLIERLVLEIYKLEPDADIEYMQQGVMRTPISIIEDNKEISILPNNVVKIIKEYFSEDGIRNKLFHPKEIRFRIKVDFKKIEETVLILIEILKNKLKEKNEYRFIPIELLK